ncbi:hypothetical protein [Thiothrix eikelboomii]|uniref:hypothetical protein n=1 Tax=Thiothrix eikelboomii TaxID=92487 RepID=UPI003BB1CAB6
MFKNVAYLIVLLLVTVVSIKLYSSTQATPDNPQLNQVLQGIQQQTASISSLEDKLKRLNNEINRLEAKTNQPPAQASAAPTAVTAPIPDERLIQVNTQLTDLKQQLAALLANQNQATDSPADPDPKPDPYAGMTPEQIQQQKKWADQQQQQLLETTITATADPGKTSQVSSSFESYLTTAKIAGSPPQVDCGATLCRFQFNQATLRTSDGTEVDPMFVLMESGTFPADGVQRAIISQKNAQGGLNLYVGKRTDFPKTSAQ